MLDHITVWNKLTAGLLKSNEKENNETKTNNWGLDYELKSLKLNETETF